MISNLFISNNLLVIVKILLILFLLEINIDDESRASKYKVSSAEKPKLEEPIPKK
jgi:hypothetical protein